VRFDLRGHGGSSTPPAPYAIADLGRDVLELMDGLELERASYCGLSIGGMVGIWLAANAPERIDRLVLVCTAAWMPTADAFTSRARIVRANGSPEPVADAVVERWLTPAYAAGHRDTRDRLRAMIAACHGEGYAACCEAIAAMDLRVALARIAAPTLVVSGANDVATPVALQQALVAAIHGARHAIVDPAAHVPVVEQPEEINRLIAEHLE
jgi:3-oxoadipate enol-lactonase